MAHIKQAGEAIVMPSGKTDGPLTLAMTAK